MPTSHVTMIERINTGSANVLRRDENERDVRSLNGEEHQDGDLIVDAIKSGFSGRFDVFSADEKLFCFDWAINSGRLDPVELRNLVNMLDISGLNASDVSWVFTQYIQHHLVQIDVPGLVSSLTDIGITGPELLTVLKALGRNSVHREHNPDFSRGVDTPLALSC